MGNLLALTAGQAIGAIKVSANPASYTNAAKFWQASGKMGITHGYTINAQGMDLVPCELGYFRPHTGRFSSPSVGKGLNLHNNLHQLTWTTYMDTHLKKLEKNL